MKTLNLRPKFMTAETIRRINKVECSRCHTERILPEGRTASIGLCAACIPEVEWEIKKNMGRLKEGETRPRRKVLESGLQSHVELNV